MKTAFESRVEYHKRTANRRTAYYATVFWNGKLYESLRWYKKELCLADLKVQAGEVVTPGPMYRAAVIFQIIALVASICSLIIILYKQTI
jgi:hypothetical protein